MMRWQFSDACMGDTALVTWEEIEKLALTDPVVYACIRQKKAGHFTETEALMTAVKVLAEVNEQYFKQLVELRMITSGGALDLLYRSRDSAAKDQVEHHVQKVPPE